MTNKEFISILDAKEETQRYEFKTACPWNEMTFAKDILALSNVQNGGYIIIGVEDGTFEAKGVTNEIKKSYDIDIMKDQMSKYADPHVNFSLIILKDNEGKEFIVIHVFQFEEIPVICKRDNQNAQVVNGQIYYRNRNRRVESASVSNSYDMRNIIELATIKLFTRRKELGYNADNLNDLKYENEISEINNIKDTKIVELLNEKIKKFGYWEMIFKPLIYKPIFMTIEDCKKIVEMSNVDITGWDFPHFPTHSRDFQALQNGSGWCQAWTDWEVRKEYWRLYKSGLFISYFSLQEDWYKNEGIYDAIEPDTKVGVQSSIITKSYEIFEFLFKLASIGTYDNGINVKISLNNLENRELWFENNRNVLRRPYRTSSNNTIYDKMFSKDDLLFNKLNNSIEFALYQFDCFGWNPPAETVQKFLEDLNTNR